MGTQRQLDLHISLLREIVVGQAGEVDARPRRDIPEVVYMLGSDFAVSLDDQSPSGVFYNDVLWAKKQLEEKGLLTVTPKNSWHSTPAAIEELRSHLLYELSKRSNAEILEILLETDGTGRQVFMSVVGRLPLDDVGALFESGQDLVDVFVEAIKRLPADAFPGLLEYWGRLF